jgi:hypothetical protein
MLVFGFDGARRLGARRVCGALLCFAAASCDAGQVATAPDAAAPVDDAASSETGPADAADGGDAGLDARPDGGAPGDATVDATPEGGGGTDAGTADAGLADATDAAEANDASDAGSGGDTAVAADAADAADAAPLVGACATRPLAGAFTFSHDTLGGMGPIARGGSVYWANFDFAISFANVMRVSVDGGAPSTLAHLTDQYLGMHFLALAVDDSAAYYARWHGNTSQLEVQAVPVDGGAGTLLTQITADAGPPSTSLAVGPTDAYLLSGTQILRVPLTGGSATPVVSTSSPHGIAVDATNLYWLDGDALLTMPLAGGATTTLASGLASPADLVIDATRAYWTSSSPATIASVPLAGGTPPVTLLSVASLDDFAVDPTYLYWTTNDNMGSAFRTPLAGGATQLIATGIVAGSFPQIWLSIAADGAGGAYVLAVHEVVAGPSVDVYRVDCSGAPAP